MTKADLIREISQQTGIERAIAAQVIEGVMEGIKSSRSNPARPLLKKSDDLNKIGLSRVPWNFV